MVFPFLQVIEKNFLQFFEQLPAKTNTLPTYTIYEAIPMEIVWEDIIVELQAFARYLTHKGVWFRGTNPVSFLSGKEIDDYVYETIGRYLENPEKFDPTKGDLVSYLKWNILRSLVSNDVRSGENHLTDVIYGGNGNDEPDSEQSSYKERLLPAALPLFSDEIDYEAVKEYIENQIRGDAVVEDIFLGLYHYGMKREKIIEEFKMSVNDYNNGVRRLDTVISRAASQFNPNKQTHEQEKKSKQI